MADADLGGYSIPKINRICTGLLNEVDLTGREAQDVLNEVFSTFLEESYWQHWRVTEVQLVKNEALEKEYSEKKKALKADYFHSKDVREVFGFSCFGSHVTEEICKHGLEARQSAPSVLGNTEHGIHVCRHADLCLKKFSKSKLPSSQVQLLVYKVTPGRSKTVSFNWDRSNPGLDATPNYDSHIPAESAKPGDKVGLAYWRSQVYLYEYDDESFPRKRPRHCLPYAVLKLLYHGGQDSTAIYSSHREIMNSSISGASLGDNEVEMLNGSCLLSNSIERDFVGEIDTKNGNYSPLKVAKQDLCDSSYRGEPTGLDQVDVADALRLAWLSILGQITVLAQSQTVAVESSIENQNDVEITEKEESLPHIQNIERTSELNREENQLGAQMLLNSGFPSAVDQIDPRHEDSNLIQSRIKKLEENIAANVQKRRLERSYQEFLIQTANAHDCTVKEKCHESFELKCVGKPNPRDPRCQPRKRNISEPGSDWIKKEAQFRLNRPLITSGLDPEMTLTLISTLEERFVRLKDPEDVQAFVCIIKMLKEDETTLKELQTRSSC